MLDTVSGCYFEEYKDDYPLIWVTCPAPPNEYFHRQYPPSPPLSSVEFDSEYCRELAAFRNTVACERAYTSPALSAASIEPSMFDHNPNMHVQSYEVQSEIPYHVATFALPPSPTPTHPRSACPSPSTSATASTASAASRPKRAKKPTRRGQRRPTPRPCKQFLCYWTGCSKPYSRDQDLRRHIKSYHEKAKFPCKFCHKTYARYDCVAKHLREFKNAGLNCAEAAAGGLKRLPRRPRQKSAPSSSSSPQPALSQLPHQPRRPKAKAKAATSA